MAIRGCPCPSSGGVVVVAATLTTSHETKSRRLGCVANSAAFAANARSGSPFTPPSTREWNRRKITIRDYGACGGRTTVIPSPPF